MKEKVIAIDGPSASGKSTVAKRLAAKYGRLYVDSGALYRTITVKALKQGIAHGDNDSVKHMLPGIKIRFNVAGGAIEFSTEGIDSPAELRTEQVSANASWVAAIPEVRSRVNTWLRGMRKLGPLVVEGRDIGTVVFPQAEHKFYLDASQEERTRRRYAEVEQRKENVSREVVGESLKKRDKTDSSRQVDPLRLAPDAVVVDSTGMNIDQVVEFISNHIASGNGQAQNGK